jgi:chemotaxis protein methyltransferase CheR
MAEAVRDCDVQAFRALLTRRLGLSLQGVSTATLASVLTRRVTEAGGPCAVYLSTLATRPSPAEIGMLAAELTVPETYFYRHAEQFRALAEVALPQRLAAREDQRRLRILSAGCASGEEAYTIAIVVRELVPAGWDVRILGVDANPTMIRRAEQARYTRWALRATPADRQRRWFSGHGDAIRLDDAVRRPVRFLPHNLVDDAATTWPPDAYDVIFCRNMLMYLTPGAASAVLARIVRSLVPGGFLFLGPAEVAYGRTDGLDVRHSHDTFYFQRPASPAAGPPPATAAEGADSIGGAARRARTRTVPRRGRGVSPRAPQARLGQPVRGGSAMREPAHASRWDLALELLRDGQYAAALEVADGLAARAPNPATRTLRAVLLLHGGDLDRAEAACHQLIEGDALDSGAHFLLAQCREARGDTAAAANSYRTATYLDPGFAVARLRLGLLARRQGHGEAARRELGHALTLLAHADQERLLLFGGGFGRRALTALCRAELLACGGVP